jgi:hypothetical protein
MSYNSPPYKIPPVPQCKSGIIRGMTSLEADNLVVLMKSGLIRQVTL